MEQTFTVTAQVDPSVAATVELITSLYGRNTIPPADLRSLVRSVRQELLPQPFGMPVDRVESEDVAEASKETIAPKPAVPIAESITHDGIFSLLDGKPYKSLKRHLAVNGYTPESYRQTFGLPTDYPMTCAAYSAARSSLARNQGLGNKKPTDAQSQSDTVKGLVANTDQPSPTAETVVETTAATPAKSRARRANSATKQPAEATA